MSEVKGVLGKGKKMQSLNLVGRREGTAMVLSEAIANLVRDIFFSACTQYLSVYSSRFVPTFQRSLVFHVHGLCCTRSTSTVSR
jgi:hypothetical protein